MSLNSAMVYRRTDRGLREVYEKSHQFTQSERLVLILLDGRLTVAGLRARLPSLDNERIERTIVKLEEAGLVEPSGTADDLQSPSRAEEVMRLEPDVVVQFLEQNELDPVTAAVRRGRRCGRPNWSGRAWTARRRGWRRRRTSNARRQPAVANEQRFPKRVAAHITRLRRLRSPTTSGIRPKPPASRSRP